jgi:hydroxyacylglutathione hydrolase
MPVEVHLFRCLADNCGVLLRDKATGQCATVDVADADVVLREAEAKGWTITQVMITHEHDDHIQGVPELARRTGAKVFGPAQAAAAGLDRIVREGDRVAIGKTTFDVLALPGHSAGHVAYVSRAARLALVGDVMFVMGCGRIFGHSPDVMWASLSRLALLPQDVRVITGHDYTLSNARFALSLDPDNPALRARVQEAEHKAAAGLFWADTTIGQEKATNPFLQAHRTDVQRRLGAIAADDAFARMREMKNTFRA